MVKKRENSSDAGISDFSTARKLDCSPGIGARTLWGGAKNLWNHLVRERRCPACTAVFMPGNRDGESAIFCRACALALKRREKGYCPNCGEPAAWPELPLAPCLRCLATPPLWDTFLFHGVHQGLLQKLLLKLKFHGQVVLAHPLGRLLAQHPDLVGLSADCVLPIPLHPSRLAQRGYNQALELARPLAEQLNLPCEPDLLERTRATLPQAGASLAVRQQNTWGAFSAPGGVRGAKLLLLDDIVTSGSTLTAATSALLEAGASSVIAVVASRTARLCQSW